MLCPFVDRLPSWLLLAGRPCQEDLDAIQSPFAATMMESCSVTQAKRLSDLFPHASRDALDLLSKLLQVRLARLSLSGRKPFSVS